MINEGFKQIFSAVALMLVHKIAEIEKEEAESPICHPVANGILHRAEHIFNFNIYAAQLCEKIIQSWGHVVLSGRRST